MQLGQPGVADLAVDQVPRDHADHLAAGGERRVGQDPHQADLPAAVDDADVAAREQPGELGGRLRVGGVRAGIGACVHADAHERAGYLHGFNEARPAGRQPHLPRHDADGRQDPVRRGPPHARPLRRGGRQLPRHRRRLRRRGVRAHARAVARLPPRRGRRGHQGAHEGLRPARRGPRSRPHPRRLRREPEAARDRRDRPLPGARARSVGAAGGDAGGARRARARPARCARSAPPTTRRGCSHGRSRCRTATAGRRSSRCSRSTRSSSARSRSRSCRSAAPPGSA